MNRTISLLVFWCVLLASISAAGQKSREDVMLVIDGDISTPFRLTAGDMAKLPRRTIQAQDHGKDTTFEGVPLIEVLKLAGVQFGDHLRGKSLATYLLAEASDGYRVVFALPELDPAFTDKIILLADRRDGKPLSGEEGRLRIVVPDEKRGSRWIRQLIKLTVRAA
jgi:hypothetical protein